MPDGQRPDLEVNVDLAQPERLSLPQAEREGHRPASLVEPITSRGASERLAQVLQERREGLRVLNAGVPQDVGDRSLSGW